MKSNGIGSRERSRPSSTVRRALRLRRYWTIGFGALYLNACASGRPNLHGLPAQQVRTFPADVQAAYASFSKSCSK